MKFSNSYAQLGDAFFKRVKPSAASKPELLLWNSPLAKSLKISEALQNSPSLAAQIFSGSQLPEGADPMALAYSGHQFGHLNPQLGDGRAHLLGELINQDKVRMDIQLKGSGRTPYSRQGDGRCALGPAIREYIMSEAMYALRVPTSRALAVVATGDQVVRDSIKPGAVVTRVASSHIRVGTFQYFAIHKDLDSLQALVDYTTSRHFPEIDPESQDKTLQFLQAAIDKQIQLVIEWMRVGFIHGVMNTDNVAISGETIDFGPCAMMGAYHPGTVFSSIDQQSRYAFGNQPSITLWNMTRLAESLLPLIHNDEKQAIALVEPLLAKFGPSFQQAYLTMLSRKLGFSQPSETHSALIQALLEIMQNKELDYTNTFMQLSMSLDNDTIRQSLTESLSSWYTDWKSALESSTESLDTAKALMNNNNPVLIPRNHHVEAVLKACEESGSAQAAEEFLAALRSPYETLESTKNYQDTPSDGDKFYRTFCGT